MPIYPMRRTSGKAPKKRPVKFLAGNWDYGGTKAEGSAAEEGPRLSQSCPECKRRWKDTSRRVTCPFCRCSIPKER